MNKMEKKDCSESVRVHSMLRFSIMLIAKYEPHKLCLILFGISRNVPVEAYARNAISTGTSQC